MVTKRPQDIDRSSAEHAAPRPDDDGERRRVGAPLSLGFPLTSADTACWGSPVPACFQTAIPDLITAVRETSKLPTQRAWLGSTKAVWYLHVIAADVIRNNKRKHTYFTHITIVRYRLYSWMRAHPYETSWRWPSPVSGRRRHILASKNWGDYSDWSDMRRRPCASPLKTQTSSRDWWLLFIQDADGEKAVATQNADRRQM